MTDPTPLEHDLQAPALPDASAPGGKTVTPSARPTPSPGFWPGDQCLLATGQGLVVAAAGPARPADLLGSLLALLAWERDISRFNGEPLPLFRKRVKFAFVNAGTPARWPALSASLSAWASAGVTFTSARPAPLGRHHHRGDRRRHRGQPETDGNPHSTLWPHLPPLSLSGGLPGHRHPAVRSHRHEPAGVWRDT